MLTINSYSTNKTSMPVLPYKNKPARRVNFSGQPLELLYKDYLKLLNKGRPVQAFLGLSGDTKTMDALLSDILLDKVKGQSFVSNLMEDPRRLTEYTDILCKKVGSGSANFMTFLPNSPYRAAYSRFIDEKFNSANSVEELLALRPDWKGAKLLEKHRQLKGDASFELGAMPVEISRDDMFRIADYLRPFMEIGYKPRKNIAPLNTGGKNYEFEFFTDGKTDKNVFGVKTESGKSYIIKIADGQRRSLDNPYALGTLAKIDTYLTRNSSRNSAPLVYYNHDRNFLVYEFVNHTPVNGDTNDLNVIMEHLPDFKKLGLKYNDNVGSNNVFLLNENSGEALKKSVDFQNGTAAKEWVSVDNDHVEYSSRLQPQIFEYHSSLPNAMGMF